MRDYIVSCPIGSRSPVFRCEDLGHPFCTQELIHSLRDKWEITRLDCCVRSIVTEESPECLMFRQVAKSVATAVVFGGLLGKAKHFFLTLNRGGYPLRMPFHHTSSVTPILTLQLSWLYPR